ncbi:ATP-binding protein [Stenotrophomonas geniculata]|uniref:ATP-binding protein n=1 Tax=Stenotrophomonas geniculata TaxID=86188 RepID=UPI002E778B89|nr:ATP-binding protein [Stenotrophomonas geniculata]
MLNQFEFKNLGPIDAIQGKNLQKINLIIGANSSGKTFLLKALYAAIRAHEEAGRGDEPREFSDVLGQKLYWTYQTEKLGDLVTRGAQRRFSGSLALNDNSALAFGFGQDTTLKVAVHHNNLQKREANSIFLPPKEVLGLNKVIVKSTIQDKTFGFDATYSDLVIALQGAIPRGRPMESFTKSTSMLEKMFQGTVEPTQDGEGWIYRKGNSRFSINITAEGVKKISILTTLLRNKYLSPSSIIFIDEPESALHPTAITQLMDIILILAKQGIQFFIATHSYFVIKKLHLIARQEGMQIPLLSPNESNEWTQQSLEDGMPATPIVEESVRLFQEELELLRK